MEVRRGRISKEEAAQILEKDREHYSEVDPELVQRFYDRIDNSAYKKKEA